MPGADYYRKQAQLCAQLALISSGCLVIARYNAMALAHLAKAAEVDASAEGGHRSMQDYGDRESDIGRG